MTKETLNLLTELAGVSGDPVAFAEMRRRVLHSHFESLPPARRDRIQALQGQIEATSAAAGTPPRAVNALLGDIVDLCHALENLERQF